MSEDIVEIPNCACGQRMLVFQHANVFICRNCDGLQPQELDGAPRAKTKFDRAFDYEMLQRQKIWYPNQHKNGGV